MLITVSTIPLGHPHIVVFVQNPKILKLHCHKTEKSSKFPYGNSWLHSTLSGTKHTALTADGFLLHM